MTPIKRTNNNNHNKILQLIKFPIRALSHARDYYIKCMINCTQTSRYPGANSVGVLVLDDHRSEDFRELVRAASVRTLRASCGRIRVVERSASVGLGMEKWFEVDVDLDDETMKLRYDDNDRS